jgi:hypothetical protein
VRKFIVSYLAERESLDPVVGQVIVEAEDLADAEVLAIDKAKKSCEFGERGGGTGKLTFSHLTRIEY